MSATGTRSGSPFRYAAFRRLTIARTVSGAGSWMQVVAAGWLVYQLTDDAFQVGILGALAKGPSLFSAPMGGRLADWLDRRRLALALTAVQMVPVALLALLSADGVITPFEVYALVFLGGLPAGLKQPVLAVIVPDLVPEPLRRRAVADSAAAYNVAALAGPAIGGGIVATLGVSAAFAVNAASFAVVFLALLLVPASLTAHEGGRRRTRVRTGAGVLVAWHSTTLRPLLVASFMFFVLVGPLRQVMPVVAVDHGDGSGVVGILLSALAFGGLVGNRLVRRLDRQHWSESGRVGVSLLVAGLLMGVLAVSAHFVVDLIVLIGVGVVGEVLWVTETTAAHFLSPEGASGQVLGLLFMTASVGIAVGSLLLGFAIQQAGLEASLVAAGAVLVVFGGWSAFGWSVGVKRAARPGA